jgi:hypothetical protein
MTRIKNNPLLKGISGMLGDVIVYRETRRGMVMSNRPRKRDQPTEHQNLAKSKFLQAVQYAKGQMTDPASKALYAAGITEKIQSAYGVALADYLKGPEILSVDVSGYKGEINQKIEIMTIDNFKVTEVRVEIRTPENELVESGLAAPVEENSLQWRYIATARMAHFAGSNIIVRAKDKPGNVTEAVISTSSR